MEDFLPRFPRLQRKGYCTTGVGIFLNGGLSMGEAAKIWDTTFLGIEVLKELRHGEGPSAE